MCVQVGGRCLSGAEAGVVRLNLEPKSSGGGLTSSRMHTVAVPHEVCPSGHYATRTQSTSPARSCPQSTPPFAARSSSTPVP